MWARQYGAFNELHIPNHLYLMIFGSHPLWILFKFIISSKIGDNALPLCVDHHILPSGKCCISNPKGKGKVVQS